MSAGTLGLAPPEIGWFGLLGADNKGAVQISFRVSHRQIQEFHRSLKTLRASGCKSLTLVRLLHGSDVRASAAKLMTRTLSSAVGERIAAAQRKRWAARKQVAVTATRVTLWPREPFLAVRCKPEVTEACVAGGKA
jgi:hypothetical protein